MFWEKINKHSKITTLAVGLLLALLIYAASQRQPAKNANTIGYSSDTVKARVLSIVEEGTVPAEGEDQPYQVVDLLILEGDYEGEQFKIDYGRQHVLARNDLLATGQEILVSVSEIPDGSVFVDFVDHIRLLPILLLTLVFVVVCVSVSGWKGISSLIGIGISIVVIIYYIIPQILNGQNPILISLLGSLLFLTITQYLVYGWTLKTHISLAAILISIVFTGLMAVISVEFTRLNGMGEESAMFLMQQNDQMNLKNLLIAGMIIGALGILDDLVLGQTSTVIEMYRANPDMTLRERYIRSMNVGKDHIAATVNTLVLAYLGASLSLFLMFSTSDVRIGNLINMNYMAEEIVRTLVGTIGLFMAVPITTFLACWVVADSDRLQKFVTVFGPLLNYSEVGRQKSATIEND